MESLATGLLAVMAIISILMGQLRHGAHFRR